MKKIILTVVALSAFGFANAQNKKESNLGFAEGDVFLSGALTFGSDSKISNYKEDNFVFAPSVGYFVSDNIAVGVNLNVGSGSVQATSASGKNKTSTFAAGLAGRYYFTPASQFSVFGELAAEYASATDNLAVPEFKVNGFGLAVAPGINYHLSNHFSVEAKWAVLGFASAKADVAGAEALPPAGLGFTFQVRL